MNAGQQTICSPSSLVIKRFVTITAVKEGLDGHVHVMIRFFCAFDWATEDLEEMHQG